MKPYSETDRKRKILGWDITDGAGNELQCAHFFARQILIAESGWIKGVKFMPDGSGRMPEEEMQELSEEELAANLNADTQEWTKDR